MLWTILPAFLRHFLRIPTLCFPILSPVSFCTFILRTDVFATTKAMKLRLQPWWRKIPNGWKFPAVTRKYCDFWNSQLPLTRCQTIWVSSSVISSQAHRKIPCHSVWMLRLVPFVSRCLWMRMLPSSQVRLLGHLAWN